MSQYQIGDYKKFDQETDKQSNFYCFPGIIFPWHGQYFILVIIKEVDMKNSENIPIYDDIHSSNLALIYKKKII